MVLVFKLAFLATTKPVLCFTKNAENLNSPRDVVSYANEKLQSGDLGQAENTFDEGLSKFSTQAFFQYEYISFLLKIGQYEKILQIKTVQGDTNKTLVEEARSCLNKMNSGKASEICSLISISPISLNVNIAMAQTLILEKKISQADNYLIFALKYYKNSPILLYLKAFVLVTKGKYKETLQLINNLYTDQFSSLRQLILNFQKIMDISDIPSKMQYLLALYREVLLTKMGINEAINIFDPLYKNVVELIVKTGCDNVQRVSTFANVLKELDPSQDNVFYYIKSLIIELRIEQAKNEMATAELNEAMKRYLNSFIALKEKEVEKQRQEQRQREQRERQQQQQQQQYSGYETKNKGKDFLSYYKTLGVDKNVKPDALKKAHRKKVRQASKALSAKSKLPKEKKDEELKNINKAFQILSNKEKRQAYDMGIDPESGPQQPSYSHNQHQYFEDDNVQDIFKSFFGGGQQSRGGSYRRAQYIFL